MSNEINMTISIPTDDEGYVLLQCEYCGTFFKGMPSDLQNDGVLHIFCPSCGLTSENYITEDVLELAMKMAKNVANDMIYDAFKNLERHSKKGFKAGKRPKHESEDPIRSGIEAMEICSFPCCKGFNDRFVMVLIRHVESYLTKIGIDMGLDEKNIYNVMVQNGQAIIANDNSSVTATAHTGMNVNELQKLIAGVREATNTLASAEDKETVSESLEVIEAEAVAEKPKRSMLKTAMASLQTVKGAAEFGAAVAALVQFIEPML